MWRGGVLFYPHPSHLAPTHPTLTHTPLHVSGPRRRISASHFKAQNRRRTGEPAAQGAPGLRPPSTEQASIGAERSLRQPPLGPRGIALSRGVESNPGMPGDDCLHLHGGQEEDILCEILEPAKLECQATTPGALLSATDSCRDLLPGFSPELFELLQDLIANPEERILSFHDGPLFVCAYLGGKAQSRYVSLGCKRCKRQTNKLYYGCSWGDWSQRAGIQMRAFFAPLLDTRRRRCRPRMPLPSDPRWETTWSRWLARRHEPPPRSTSAPKSRTRTGPNAWPLSI